MKCLTRGELTKCPRSQFSRLKRIRVRTSQALELELEFSVELRFGLGQDHDLVSKLGLGLSW